MISEASDDMDEKHMILYSDATNGPITVHYASAKVSTDRIDLKNALALRLLQDADATLSQKRNAQLFKSDRYGCPRFIMRHLSPIKISFSYQGQVIWAAVAQAKALGIDVENPENFSSPYPFDRVFINDEFRHVTDFCANREDAAALLWSCKEAAVKNLGLGFHYMDPRDVRICSCLEEAPFSFRLLVMTPPKNILVVAKREQHLWLAIAVSG